jgi:hypothetical protein
MRPRDESRVAHQRDAAHGHPAHRQVLNGLQKRLEDALSRGFRAMVLTNAMKPMHKMKPALLRLREGFGDRLTLRVSIDH